MKTIQQLKEEAQLEAKAITELETRKLVDLIETAIKKGLRYYVGPEDLEVYVTVPGRHLYKSRGSAVPSVYLNDVLEEYDARGIKSSVVWENLGADKEEKSKFKLTIPSRMLSDESE